MVDVVRPIIFLYQSNNIEAHVKWQIVMADIGIGGIDDTPALSPRYRFFGGADVKGVDAGEIVGSKPDPL